MAEIPTEAFLLRRSIHVVPSADHVSNFEGFTLPVCQYMPCKKARKSQIESHDLYLKWRTFLPLEGIFRILDQPRINIAVVIQDLSTRPGRFRASLQLGARLDSVRLNRGPYRGLHDACIHGSILFYGGGTPNLLHLWRRYPREYITLPTSTIPPPPPFWPD